MYCHKCGAPVPEGMHYCHRCGESLPAALSPAPTPPRRRKRPIAAAAAFLSKIGRRFKGSKRKTVLLSCELGEHIHPAGFHDWNKPQAHETVFYAEHGSYGPGAAGIRAGYVHSLTDSEAAAYTLDAFLAHALEQA